MKLICLTFIKSDFSLYYTAYLLSVDIVAFIFLNEDIFYVFIALLYELAIQHFLNFVAFLRLLFVKSFMKFHILICQKFVGFTCFLLSDFCDRKQFLQAVYLSASVHSLVALLFSELRLILVGCRSIVFVFIYVLLLISTASVLISRLGKR